jgi:hypothetical protein
MYRTVQNHWSHLVLLGFIVLIVYALSVRIEKINNERSTNPNRLMDFVIR